MQDQPLQPPRALEMATRGLLSLSTALLLLIVTLIVAQIVARNFWNIGLPRAEEISRYAGVLMVYLTVPLLSLHGLHVAVDAFTGAMPRLPRLACATLAEASVLAFAALTLWGGWLYLERAWKFKTPALGIRNIWLYAPIMLSLVLLIAVAGWRITATMRAGKTRA
nr:TRAP transporter small permease subunit [Paracoccus saliphilus]